MNLGDFEDLIGRGRAFTGVVSGLYKDLTGEDLDVESAIRHYPFIAAGIVGGAGVALGWAAAQRAAKRREALQPPPAPGPSLRNPMEMLDGLLPGTSERLRSVLPENLPDEATLAARVFMDDVVEPRMKRGLENLDTLFGGLLRGAIDRLEPGEDVRLDDPETT